MAAPARGSLAEPRDARRVDTGRPGPPAQRAAGPRGGGFCGGGGGGGGLHHLGKARLALVCGEGLARERQVGDGEQAQGLLPARAAFM